MSQELTEQNINVLIGGSLGGLFLTIMSFILRKYIKSSKCHNPVFGNIEINSNENQNNENQNNDENKDIQNDDDITVQIAV